MDNIMEIEKVRLVYFSPTGTTKTVLENMAAGIGAGTVEHFDVTLPGAGQPDFPEMSNNNLLIIGAPVYAGRIPEIAVQRFQKLKSNKSPAVIVVLYGNREIEDALVELADLAARAKPGLLILYHQLFHGLSEQELLSEVRERYQGRVVSGRDLEVY